MFNNRLKIFLKLKSRILIIIKFKFNRQLLQINLNKSNNFNLKTLNNPNNLSMSKQVFNHRSHNKYNILFQALNHLFIHCNKGLMIALKCSLWATISTKKQIIIMPLIVTNKDYEFLGLENFLKDLKILINKAIIFIML